MFESQQARLVTGLQELYKNVVSGKGWTGDTLQQTSHGVPLIHGILERLAESKEDCQSAHEKFKEDLNAMQRQLIESTASTDSSSSSIDGPKRIILPASRRCRMRKESLQSICCLLTSFSSRSRIRVHVHKTIL
jgi:hypothetical protein